MSKLILVRGLSMWQQALIFLALTLPTACAGRPQENPEAHRTKAELSALKGEVSRLKTKNARLDGSNRELRRQKKTLETQLGRHPFEPKQLKSGQRGWRFNPDKATLIEQHGDSGRPVSMTEYVGRFDAYVVAVWATWCKPCTSREELTQLKRLQSSLKTSGSALLGVAIDDLKKVLNHQRAPSWHYPIWHREDANIEWLPKAFVQTAGLSLPLFLVVSGDGELLYWHNAPLTDGIREEMLTATLAHTVHRALPPTQKQRRRRTRRRR